ncbi:MAG: plasmid mobilization relaxosome protein MobC [Firmicutes bacterium]|nr:plasmid mobilization relaxosome protein MobC [Bacillota bacterium]
MPRNRNERFTIRLTAYEKAYITCKMRESGFNNLADYFLYCVGNNKTFVVDMLPILEVKNELNKIGCNINQIAKKANTNGFLSRESIDMLMEDMDKMKDTINWGFNACAKGSEAIGVCEDSTYKAKHAS